MISLVGLPILDDVGQLLLNLCLKGLMNIARLMPEIIAGVANVVTFDVVAFHAERSRSRPEMIRDRTAATVRAAQRLDLVLFPFGNLLWIIADQDGKILRQSRRGPVIDDQLTHLFRH